MRLFQSLSARIALTCMVLVLLTATSLMLFAHKDTISALRKVERRSLDNILYLVERELGLMADLADNARAEAVNALKTALRGNAARAVARLPEAQNLLPDGILVFKRSAAGWTGPDGALLQPEISAALEGVPPEGGFGLLDNFTGLKHAQAQGSAPAFLLPFATPEGRGVVAATASPGAAAALEDRLRRSAEAGIGDLLQNIKIQRTGYVAVLDGTGNMRAGTGRAAVPDELRSALRDPAMARTPRRVMVLPGPHGDILYLIGYFRPYDWHVVLAAPLDELEAPAFALVDRQLMLTALVALAAIAAGLVLGRLVAGPVKRLTRFARSLPEQNMLELDVPAYTAQLPATGGEVGELSGAFRYMTNELSRNVRELVAAESLRQRLEGELSLARDIQYGMLPTKFPHGDTFVSAASMITAKEVGGDLYDFFFLDEHRLCFVLGDVSDKGVPAALFMSMTVTLVRSALKAEGLPVDKALVRINDTLAQDNPRGMFVTLVIGVIDTRTGEVVWASGGHLPPLLLRPGAGGLEVTALPASGDMVVGSFDGLPYRLLSVRLEPGDTFFLYTDGVTEAMNPDLEEYGEHRLFSVLRSVPEPDPAALIPRLMEDVAAHAEGAEQSDDITILALRFTGPTSF